MLRYFVIYYKDGKIVSKGFYEMDKAWEHYLSVKGVGDHASHICEVIHCA